MVETQIGQYRANKYVVSSRLYGLRLRSIKPGEPS